MLFLDFFFSPKDPSNLTSLIVWVVSGVWMVVLGGAYFGYRSKNCSPGGLPAPNDPPRFGCYPPFILSKNEQNAWEVLQKWEDDFDGGWPFFGFRLQEPRKTDFGPSWAHLGPILGPSWAHLGPILGLFGAP